MLLKEYHFWGVIFRYVSDFEDIIVNELNTIGVGDTREEVLHDVKFKMWDEIKRLHDMGEQVTANSREEAEAFAKHWCDELRGDAESEVTSWSLVPITIDMENQPPGLPQEQLDAIAAFEREGWEEYLREVQHCAGGAAPPSQ